MLNKVRRLVRRLQIKIKYFRSKFDIVIQGKMPHIKISEKYEKSVKWILRILTAVGIITSIIAFSTWYYSLTFAVVLFLFEQIFEQIIFTQKIMLVQPLPQNWDGSKWTAMLVVSDGRDISLGFAFSDISVGKDFWNTLFAWNEDMDTNIDNIQLTLVQEDSQNYSVHIYPTIERTFVKENLKIAQKRFDKRKNAGKELEVLVTQICFCKVFPMSPTCAYNYLQGKTHDVTIEIFDASKVVDDDPSSYMNVTLMDKRTMVFKNVTVCKRSELNKETNTTEYYNVPKY